MHQVHDPRRIPLDPEPADEGLLARIRRGIAKMRGKAIERDTAQQIATIRNRPLRMAIARRQLRQPGQHYDVIEKGLAVLGRIGRGSA